MRFVIAFDLDGVISDIYTPWYTWYNREFGDDLKVEDVVTWDVHKYAKHGKAVYEYFDVPGAFLRPKPYPGAVECLLRLSHHYQLIITTATSGSQKMAAEKWMWIGNHLPWFDRDYLVFCENKSVIRAELLVDDGLHNIEAFQGTGIVFNRPWNKEEVRPHFRISSWGEVGSLVEFIMQTKKRRVQWQ